MFEMAASAAESLCLFPSYHCWSLRLRPIAFAFATAFIDFTVPSRSDTSICLRQSCKKLSCRRADRVAQVAISLRSAQASR